MEGFVQLALCILSTCILLIGLRYVQRYPVDLPICIGINYLAAALVGWLDVPLAFHHVAAHPAVAILASVHGASFFILFSIMGWMTHRVGLGYMTIVAKMSLVIPVLFSWLFYGDAMAWLRFVGVGLALAAIWMVHFGEQGRERPMDPQEHPWRVPALSAILFLGSGASDALFRVIQQEYSGLVDHRAYVIVLFAAAAAASLPVFVYKGIHGTLRLHAPTVLGGLLMGIPNYYSIVFLAGSLRYFDGTVFYPVNNTAILLVMALAGIVFFGERLNGWKVAGLLVATGAVVMLNG